MSPKYHANCTVLLSLFPLLSSVPAGLAQPRFRFVPVEPQGLTSQPYPAGTIIDGTTITLPGGAATRVWFEFRVRNWGAVGDGTLNALQGQTDPATYANGVGAPLAPPQVFCNHDSLICANEIGLQPCSGGTCQAQNDTYCMAAFRQERSDGFPGGHSAWVTGCHADWPGLSCGASTLVAPPADDGKEHYAASFALDVPADAAGSYVIGPSNLGTWLQTGDEALHSPEVSPAVVTICDPAICAGLKNRFLPIGTSDASAPTGIPFGIRVKMLDVPALPTLNGQVRWVGYPASTVDPANGEDIKTARLQCPAHLGAWASVGIVHLYGPEIVPDSSYEVRFGDAECVLAGDESCLSPPRLYRTGRWGDVRAPFYSADNPYQPNALDFAAVVDKFLNRAGAPSLTRAKLHASVPNLSAGVNFLDVSAGVDAYRGNPYSFAGPAACP